MFDVAGAVFRRKSTVKNPTNFSWTTSGLFQEKSRITCILYYLLLNFILILIINVLEAAEVDSNMAFP